MSVYKPDATEAKGRIEAWWRGDVLDRPPLIVTAPRARPRTPGPPKPVAGDPAAIERGFTDPDLVVPGLRNQLGGRHYLGEAFPVMYPVATRMVAILGNYLGCPMRFVNDFTAWSSPILHDWESRPTYSCDLTSHHWEISAKLLRAAVDRSDGYFVGAPDLNGPTEILSRLRSPEHLATDFYDHPGRIKPALAEINQAWYGYWSACTEITQRLGGYFHWMGIWSDRPSIDLQSDFSCMMSGEMFDTYFLPYIAEQTEMVERTVFHLDGPDAIRHLDSLLDLPHLNGIQWVPGAGEKPMSEWLPLLKRIKRAGKLVFGNCTPAEVPLLVKEIGPDRLLLSTACADESEAQHLLRALSKLAC